MKAIEDNRGLIDDLRDLQMKMSAIYQINQSHDFVIFHFDRDRQIEKRGNSLLVVGNFTQLKQKKKKSIIFKLRKLR